MLFQKASGQPTNYVEGTVRAWAVGGGKYVAYYHSPGFDYHTGLTCYVFGGAGQNEFDTTTLKSFIILNMVNAGWNGLVPLPGGGTGRIRVIVNGDQGYFDNSYANEMSFVFGNMPADTADHTKFLLVGVSAGVGNMWSFKQNLFGLANSYRNIWGMTLSMSGISVANNSDLQAAAALSKNSLYYGCPDCTSAPCGGSYRGDGNCLTPFSFSSFLYSDLPGTPNVDKRLKWNPTGTHGFDTWSQRGNINAFFNDVGTDSSTNGFIWAMTAYKTPGTNLPPIANAGANQVIGGAFTSTILNGGGSSDPDGTIASYAWTKLSGPSGGTLASPSSAVTNITGLTPGLYSYRLVVTDNAGATADDTVQVYKWTGTTSTNPLTINTADYYWPWSGNGRMQNFFVAGNRKKIDTLNGVYSYELPIDAVVELKDSTWNNVQIKMFHGSNLVTQTWDVMAYDSTRTQVWTTSFTQAILPTNDWFTVPGNADTITKAVRYLRFRVNSAASSMYEIQIYGDQAQKASTIIDPNQTATIIPDPGIYHIGGSDIGNMDTTYAKTQSDKPLYPSFRHPTNGGIWNHTVTDAFNAQRVVLDTYGDMDKAVLRFNKRLGVQGMLYINGASFPADPAITDSSYSPNIANLNLIKDIVKGSDSTQPAEWAKNTARVFGALAGLWGNNINAPLNRYVIGSQFGADRTAGQKKIKILENENEWDADFVGTPTFGRRHHHPEDIWARSRSIWDTVHLVDPDMLVYLGATYSADTMKWKGYKIVSFFRTGSKINDEIQGLCFNMYQSTYYDGQPQNVTAQAVSPEQFQVKRRMDLFAKFRDRVFPGKDMKWTEIGFSTTTSPYQVFAVTGFPDSAVAAYMQIRTLEQAARVPNSVSTVYHYKHTSDGSGNFGGMSMVTFKFAFPVSEYYRRPVWYAYATRVNTLWNYKAWSSTILDGDSTGVTLVRRDHNTDRLKKAYTIWRGTYNGSTTSNQVVTVGNAESATLITWANGDEDGVSTPLTVTNGTVTIPTVTEMPAYILVSLKNDLPTNPVIRGRTIRFK